jgi:hypothetical protein
MTSCKSRIDRMTSRPTITSGNPESPSIIRYLSDRRPV